MSINTLGNMVKIGMFQIQDSFKLTDRGLVALGQIIEGKVKIGSYLTFEANNNNVVSLKIAGVEMTDNISTKEYWVGLLFTYKDEQQRIELENMKLNEQLAEVTE